MSHSCEHAALPHFQAGSVWIQRDKSLFYCHTAFGRHCIIYSGGYVSLPNCICFHPSEPAGAILRWCSISRLCLFRIVHKQEQNALPAQRADNICEPIIYPVEHFNSQTVVWVWKRAVTWLLSEGDNIVHDKKTLTVLKRWYRCTE